MEACASATPRSPGSNCLAGGVHDHFQITIPVPGLERRPRSGDQLHGHLRSSSPGSRLEQEPCGFHGRLDGTQDGDHAPALDSPGREGRIDPHDRDGGARGSSLGSRPQRRASQENGIGPAAQIPQRLDGPGGDFRREPSFLFRRGEKVRTHPVVQSHALQAGRPQGGIEHAYIALGRVEARDARGR